MYIRKTMVLSALDNGNEKGVLNLESEKEMLVGSLRLYNFSEEPSGVLSLGILVNEKVYKAGLNQKTAGLYYFTTEKIDDIKDRFSCAIVNIKNGKATPILMGATDGQKPKTDDVNLASAISILDEKHLTIEKVEKILNENNIDLPKEEKEVVSKTIDKEFEKCDCEKNKCVGCKYREAFYKDGEDVEIKKEPEMEFSEDMLEDEKEENFFDEISEQINELFESYPEEDFLMSVIPNSKWVKVDYEETGEYYVVGLIYEDEEIKYVCYGVPAMYSSEPPKELTGMCQWLPLDKDKREDFGYWITYQDADTGENVEVDII